MPDTATPGADLCPLDRLIATAGKDRPPDRTGAAYGYVYAMWQQHPLDSVFTGKIHVYIADKSTGEIVPGSKPRTHRPGRREIPYQYVDTWAEAERVPAQAYWKHRNQETPLEDLQERIRRALHEKTRTIYWERRRECEMRRYERDLRERTARRYGKSPSRVSRKEMEIVDNAGRRMAEAH